jgi:hypothetical protein
VGNLTENINESAYADALADDPENPHLYIAGKTRSGKSNLLFFRIMADILRGRGLCVIDAKSGLVAQLKQWIPQSLVHKCIYLGPDNEIPLDWMSYGGTTPRERENERQKLAAEIKYLFLKTTNTAAMPIIKSNTNWIVNSLLDYNDNPATPANKQATFLDIYHFLTNKIRQREIIAGLTHPQLKAHWQNPRSFPEGVNLEHLTTRIDEMISTSGPMERIFDCPEPKLNVSRAIYEGRIILVDLGDLTETQTVYATLLVSKIRQHFYRNLHLRKDQISHFWLYADEFQTFQNSDFNDMLSRAGGLGLHLILSNLFPGQITAPGTWEHIFKNINNYFLFQLDPTDTAMFKPYFPKPYEPEDRTADLRELRDQYALVQRDVEHIRGAFKQTPDKEPREYWERKSQREAREQYNEDITKLLGQNVTRAELLKEQLSTLTADIEEDQARAKPDFQKELIHMPRGKCVYLAMNKKICRIIETPPPRPEHNPHNNAALIDRVTEHQFSAEPFDRSCYNEPIHAHSDPNDEDFAEKQTRVPPNRKKKGRS